MNVNTFTRTAGICLLFLSMGIASIGFTQTKRALLIGIDKYVPEKQTALSRGSMWFNLDGCLNDVDAMKSVLASNRYGFSENNMVILKNEEATRKNILNNLDVLAKESRKGDVVIIFYSGHGSQVKNSLSDEDDKKDEAIVPSDAGEGTPYIRDKELSIRLNNICDKGVILTVLLDCCNSGSMSRGLPITTPPKVRFLPMDTVDVKDATTISVKPYEKGALIISAAMDNQVASETKGDQNIPQGAFTCAFIKAMLESPIYESAENIFLKTSAKLRDRGNTQIPVMEGKPERQKLSLFGDKPENYNGKTLLVVTRIIGDTVLELGGGIAIGLTPNSVLKKLNDPDQTEIIVTKVVSLTHSEGGVKRTDRNKIKAGDMLEVTAWGAPDRPNLYVFAPPADLTFNELTQLGTEIEKWLADNNFKSVIDPSIVQPSHTIYYTAEGWKLHDTVSSITDLLLGKKPDLKKLKQFLGKSGKVTLFVHYPPCKELYAKLNIGKDKLINSVEFTDQANAQYTLTGRFHQGQLCYSWIIPNLTWNDTNWRSTLPVSTDWVGFSLNGTDQQADSLTMLAAKLGKIRGWLTLEAPPDEGSFPFNLGLKNSVTGEIKKDLVLNANVGEYLKGTPTGNPKTLPTTATTHENEEYGLVLYTDPQNFLNWDRTKRWVYVFAIDSKGKSDLLFPRSSNMDNLVPYTDDYKDFWMLGPRRTFVVSPPYGNDTYFLLVSNENIPNPISVFEFPGVRTRSKGSSSPLRSLLENTGATQRGFASTIPSDWLIQKITVKSYGKSK